MTDLDSTDRDECSGSPRDSAENNKVRREENEFRENEHKLTSNPPPSESPSKSKPKPKPKPRTTTARPASKEVGPVPTPKDNDEGAGDEELTNVKDLLNYKAQVDDLIFKIYNLKPQPMAKLRTLDLDELKVLHDELSAAQSTQAPKAGATSSKPKAKQPVRGVAALPTTTPRKVASSRVYTSKIKTMGSPIVAVAQTQEQAARAAKTLQDTKKRPRNDSLGLEDVRRLCLEPREPWEYGTLASSGPSASASSTWDNSLAPSVMSARSKSTVSSRYNSIGPKDFQEAMDTIDQPEDAAHRKVPVGTSGPPSKKPRVTKHTFKGTAFEKLIDFAVPFTGALLVANMCPDPNEYNLAIAEAWDTALEYYDLSPETHAMNADHRSVVKQLFSACRSRAHKNLAEGIASEYGLQLSSTNTIETVKKKAADLIPIGFHHDPEAIGPNAGHYRREFLARALALVWLSGTNAVGKLYQEVLNPVPINLMAYLCGLIEDILTRFKKDGCIKTEKKAKKGKGNKEVEGKGKGKGKGKKKGKGRATDDLSDGNGDGDSNIDSKDEDFARATIDDVKAPMLRHLKGLKSFRDVLKHKFAKYQKKLFKNALKCVGPHQRKPGFFITMNNKVEPEAEYPEDGLGKEAFADEVDSEPSDDLSDEEPKSDHEPPQPGPRSVRPLDPRTSLHLLDSDLTATPQCTTSLRPTPPQQKLLVLSHQGDTGKPTALGRGPNCVLNVEGDERDVEHHLARLSNKTSRPAQQENKEPRGPGEEEEGEEEQEEEPAPKANGGSGDELSEELAAAWTPHTSKVAVVSSQSKRRFQALFEDDDMPWPKDDPKDIGKDIEMATENIDDGSPAEIPGADAMDLDDQGPTNAQPSMPHVGTGSEASTGGSGAIAGSANRSESPLTSPPPALPPKRKGLEMPASADSAAEDLEDRTDRMRQALERLRNQRGANSDQGKLAGKRRGAGEAKPKAAKSGAGSGPAANTRRRIK
ncbi:hypothetical protein RhiLY_07167 [Ceratobasidium sp. AG-Ba]|nr:hypothetical protein RhiLY_07167 [Ceratobasidium sp. AG-Ba]